jgi:hypothetical protein
MADLSAKYRPKKWSDVVGQDKAVSEVRESLKQGWGGRAWWIVGESGTGCTSLAMLIATERCAEERVCSVYSGRVDAAMARRMANENPGKEKTVANRAYVIDRPAGLPPDSASLLTSVLPCLHPNICVVFTHTFAEDHAFRMERPDAVELIGLCQRVELAREGLEEAFAKRCKEIAEAEGLGGKPLTSFKALARRCKFNMRAILKEIEAGAMCQGS